MIKLSLKTLFIVRFFLMSQYYNLHVWLHVLLTIVFHISFTKIHRRQTTGECKYLQMRKLKFHRRRYNTNIYTLNTSLLLLCVIDGSATHTYTHIVVTRRFFFLLKQYMLNFMNNKLSCDMEMASLWNSDCLFTLNALCIPRSPLHIYLRKGLLSQS